MLTDLPAAGFAAVMVALAPAFLRLWWGRPLVANVDDPALPERLAANQRRNTHATAACCAVLVVGWISWVVWTLPLLVGARVVAGYPLRRRLYGETWSVTAYLSFLGRLLVALFGFWIVLALLPYVSLRAGTRGWTVALLIGTVLVIWNARSAHLLRRLMRARPIDDVVLLSRFEPMVAASGIPSPRFDYVDLRGGVVANAIAVPGLRDSGVIFTNTLLARLDTNEIVAICAHELAHLEHYDGSRMRRLNAAGLALVSVGAAMAPLVQLVARDAASLVCTVLWPFAVLVFLMWRARDRQKHETASDLRAVALCGDADALARALTKLYAFARLPRRSDLERERQATHPSLARRLRDIRAAAGAPRSGPDAPVCFVAPRATASVTFERGHLTWQEGSAATHRFSYSHLTELRLDAPPSGAPRLVAVEATGRRWEMSLPHDEVGRAQQILDEVDGELSQPVHMPSITPVAARLLTAIAALVGCAAGQFAFGVVALLAACRCAGPLVVAAGAAAMTAAALTLRDARGLAAPWMAATLAFVGFVLLALGWLKRRDTADAAVTRMAAILGLLGALFLALFLSHGVNPVRLHQAARASHAVPVLLVSFAAALAFMRARVARYVAVLAAATGLLAIVAGSALFLDRVGRDPFLVRAEPLPFKVLNGSPISEIEVKFDVGDLRLSPHGSSIAVSPSEDDDSAEHVSMVHIGPASGPLIAVRADDLAFVDERHLVTMSAGDGGADVRAIRLDDPTTDTWHVHVDAVRSGALSVNAATGCWQILGWDRSRRIVRAEGRVGDAAVAVTHWNGFAANGAWVNATATSGTTLLAVDKRYDRGIFASALLRPWYLPLFPMHNASRVWRVTPDVQSHMSTSLLDTDCTANVIDDELICTAYDGTRTGILRIDTATATPIPIGSVEGRFIAYGSGSPEWLTGWLDSTPAAVRVTTRDAVRVNWVPRPMSLAAGVDAIATVSYGTGGSVVRVYRY